MLQRGQRANIGQTVGKNIRGQWAGQHFQLTDPAASTLPALKPSVPCVENNIAKSVTITQR